METYEDISPADSRFAEQLRERHHLTAAMARIFAARFREHSDQAEAYLAPSMSRFVGLKEAPALPAVLDALTSARRNAVPTLFYGDYDVDGVASTYMLYRLAQHLGLKAMYFLPSRFNEGYGLSRRIVEQAAELDYRLLFALDCGTANLDEVNLARDRGLDVLILDHHRPVGPVPDVPLINPHLADRLSPMCTAALAFGLAREWLAVEGESPNVADQNFLEFAALGTIADVVPLVDDSFVLAHFGMEKLPLTGNVGLQALLRALKLHKQRFLTWRDLAFSVIPCLNAAGRMAHARHAAELFLAQDDGTATELALAMLKLNRERKTQQSRIFDEATQQAELFPEAAVLVLYAPDWNQGITGIVASKMVDAYGRPVLIFSNSSSEEGMVVGSGRAPANCDLLATILPLRELFKELGGHSGAVGGGLERGRLEELKNALADVEVATVDTSKAKTAYDAALSPDDILSAMVDDLQRAYPFGEGYPPPRVLLQDAKVNRVFVVGYEKTHLALTVAGSSGAQELRVIGFQMSHLADRIREGESYDLGVELELDNFGGELSVQLRLLEVRTT